MPGILMWRLLVLRLILLHLELGMKMLILAWRDEPTRVRGRCGG